MLGKTAFLFPGEGSNSVAVGMGLNILGFPEARRVFDAADRVFAERIEGGQSISDLFFHGPREKLRKFEPTLFAAVTVGIAAAKVAARRWKRKPNFVAGFCAGYIPALVYAKVITAEDGLRIAAEVARLVRETADQNPGRMVVVVDPISSVSIEMVCEKIDGVWVGLYNTASQAVLSGTNEAVDAALGEIESKALATATVPLIRIPVHSPLLEPIAEPFARFLEGIHFARPKAPIVGNCQAELIQTAEEAREEAVRLPWSPVYWTRVTDFLLRQGIITFAEIGHGDALLNMLKQDKRAQGRLMLTMDDII